MTLSNSPSSQNPDIDTEIIPSRSHYSPRLKLMLQTQVTKPEVMMLQSFSKGVYGFISPENYTKFKWQSWHTGKVHNVLSQVIDDKIRDRWNRLDNILVILCRIGL